MAPTTARSPSPRFGLVSTRSTPLRTASSAILPWQTLPSHQARPSISASWFGSPFGSAASSGRSGYPDRAAEEFFKGDGANYWLWGWNLRYALLFPNDLTYTIGKSDPHRDWFFEEVPHATDLSFVNPEAKDPANQRFGWVKAESLDKYPQTDQRGPWEVYGKGRETVWTIKFNVDKKEQGTAALRVALAGVNGLRDGLLVKVNGHDIGSLGDG